MQLCPQSGDCYENLYPLSYLLSDLVKTKILLSEFVFAEAKNPCENYQISCKWSYIGIGSSNMFLMLRKKNPGTVILCLSHLETNTVTWSEERCFSEYC